MTPANPANRLRAGVHVSIVDPKSVYHGDIGKITQVSPGASPTYFVLIERPGEPRGFIEVRAKAEQITAFFERVPAAMSKEH